MGSNKHHTILSTHKTAIWQEKFWQNLIKRIPTFLLTSVLIIILVFVLTVIIYDRFLFYSFEKNPAYHEIDSCLDAGGRWNYQDSVCKK
jgi:hypothetical protein